MRILFLISFLSSVDWFESELKTISDSVSTQNTFPSKELGKPFYTLLFSYLNLRTETRDMNHQLTTFHLSKSAPVVCPSRPKSQFPVLLPSCYPLTVRLFVIAQKEETEYNVPPSKHTGKNFKMTLSMPWCLWASFVWPHSDIPRRLQCGLHAGGEISFSHWPLMCGKDTMENCLLLV